VLLPGRSCPKGADCAYCIAFRRRDTGEIRNFGGCASQDSDAHRVEKNIDLNLRAFIRHFDIHS
jgi:hypothetical protein